MTNIKLNTFESNPEWNTLEIQQKRSNWTIISHTDGDVEIECCTDNSANQLILTQDELRQVIAFLQTKLK